MKKKYMTRVAALITILLMLGSAGACQVTFQPKDEADSQSADASQDSASEQSSESSQDSEETSGEETAAVTFDGKGTEKEPWLIGKTNADAVRAFLVEKSLFFEGEGEMVDFEKPEDRPWHSVAADIDTVNMGFDIVNVGDYAFCGVGSEEEFFGVYLSDCVRTIGKSAFEGLNCPDFQSLTLPETVTEIRERAFAKSHITEFWFNSKPAIEKDAFTDVTAVMNISSNQGWTDEEKAMYGGTLTYAALYIITTEEICGDETIGNGYMAIPEGEMCDLDATMNIDSEAMHFVRYELVSGDVAMEDPTDPRLQFKVAGDVVLRIHYEKN